MTQGGNPNTWTAFNIENYTSSSDYQPYKGFTPGVGKVNRVLPHATENLLIGTPDGGIWRKDSDGWTPLTDGLPNLGVSGIVRDPADSNTLFVISGDGDYGDTPTTGFYKSVDNGDNWELVTLDDLLGIDSSFGWYFGNIRIALDERIVEL